MEYIVNPHWFYWIRICDALKTVTLIIGTILFIACATGWICVLLWGDELGEHDERKFRSVLCVTSAICAASFLIGILIPSRNALIEMKVAEIATWENAYLTVDKIKEIIDYFMSAVNGVK